MDKTIENKLFDEFRNGAASMCLEYFKEKEDWEEAPTEYLAYSDTDKVLSKIKERTEAFDDIAWPMGRGDSFPLAEEIIRNLDSCSTDKQRENYIIDILVVFKDWAAIFSPIAEINEMKKAIELSQNDDEYGMLERYKDSLDYLEGLHDHYLEIMEKPKDGTIEYYFDLWHRCYRQFCRMLAAELAKYGMNLLEIQNKRGIWLVEKLDTLSIQAYFGISNNFGYANNLLEELNAPNTNHLIFTERNHVISNLPSQQIQILKESIEQNVKHTNSNIPSSPVITISQSDKTPTRKNKKRGRRSVPFEDNIIGDDEKKGALIKTLHALIDGRKGREVALIIYTCVARGLLHKPTFKQVEVAFGFIGDKSGYNRYMSNPKNFSNEEIEGMSHNFDSI